MSAKPFGEFVAANPDIKEPRRGGQPCSTCQLADVEILNAACRDLDRRRRLPLNHPESITWSWRAFYREYVCTQFPGFKPSDPRKFFRHVDECLGIDREINR